MRTGTARLLLFILFFELGLLFNGASCIVVKKTITPAPSSNETTQRKPASPESSLKPAPSKAERQEEADSVASAKPSDMELRTLRLINEQRKKNGAPPLAFDETAYKAALLHSRDMAKRGYFSHESPEGQSVTDRLKRFNFKFYNVAWGENLAKNFNAPDPVQIAVKGWMNSPGHRRNILDRRFRYSGVAISQDRRGTYYFTQVFWGKL